MPKKLEDIVIKGWCRANLALLSKSTIKEISVFKFFKNLTTKSAWSGFNVAKSSYHDAQELWNPEIQYIYLPFASPRYTKKGSFYAIKT